MLWAMAFAEWTCRECGQKVEWVDAVCEDDGHDRLVAVRHKDCAE